jgi:hypothetical protein
MSENRNDPCPCGSGRKYKNCHLKPFYPKESFEVKVKACDPYNPIKIDIPKEIMEIDDIKIYVRDPLPRHNEIIQVLNILNQINWNEKDRWQKYAKGRIQKLFHKLDALKFFMSVFVIEEKRIENNYKQFSTLTQYNIITDNPLLIYSTESFLFQSKSCLDVFAQLIGNNFKFCIHTYGNNGQDLINKIIKNPLKEYPDQCIKLQQLLNKNKPWIEQLVEMRDLVTHYSDLEGLACFFQRKCQNKNDLKIKIYYPALPDGTRVSAYMKNNLHNIQKLIKDYSEIIYSMFSLKLK